MEEKLLEVKDLSVAFNSYLGVAEVLDRISYSVDENQWLGIAGESGCGKTVSAFSLLKLLPEAAMIRNGEILFKGESILDKSEREMRKLRGGEISIVFQEPQSALNPSKRVGENIVESLRLHQGIRGEEAKRRAIQMLDLVKIPQPRVRFSQFPHELSGGMQQRVCIAIALACHPSLLIADEFTTSLDVTTQQEILKLVVDLQRQSTMSVLFITHDLALISECCDELIIMYAGQIMERGKVDRVFRNPSHPYTRLLLNAIPSISRKDEKLNSIDGSVPGLVNPPKGCRFHTRCKQKIPGRCDVVFPRETAIDETHRAWCHLLYT
ncbi:ABC transporter ATP-binding protein [Candidatus Fermentibacteria bacterium]|nr:ABC transporter ATP-binding protein [Candidatus Fermentibacteria bacterium]